LCPTGQDPTRKGQRPRRRGRPWSSDWRVGRPRVNYAPLRHARTWRAARPRHLVYRRRRGGCRRGGTAVTKPGFWSGGSTLVAAARQLASSPQLWRYAVVPILVLLSLSLVGITLLTWFGVPRVFHAVVAPDSQVWYEQL